MSFAQKKEMDFKVQIGIFALMIIGVLSHDLLIRCFATVMILSFATLEWHRLSLEERKIRRDCVV